MLTVQPPGSRRLDQHSLCKQRKFKSTTTSLRALFFLSLAVQYLFLSTGRRFPRYLVAVRQFRVGAGPFFQYATTDRTDCKKYIFYKELPSRASQSRTRSELEMSYIIEASLVLWILIMGIAISTKLSIYM